MAGRKHEMIHLCGCWRAREVCSARPAAEIESDLDEIAVMAMGF